MVTDGNANAFSAFDAKLFSKTSIVCIPSAHTFGVVLCRLLGKSKTQMPNWTIGIIAKMYFHKSNAVELIFGFEVVECVALFDGSKIKIGFGRHNIELWSSQMQRIYQHFYFSFYAHSDALGWCALCVSSSFWWPQTKQWKLVRRQGNRAYDAHAHIKRFDIQSNESHNYIFIAIISFSHEINHYFYVLFCVRFLIKFVMSQLPAFPGDVRFFVDSFVCIDDLLLCMIRGKPYYRLKWLIETMLHMFMLLNFVVQWKCQELNETTWKHHILSSII